MKLLTAEETNAILALRNEVRYFTTKVKAEAGLETLRASERAHGRAESQLSLGKNGRQHFVFIQRVEIV